MSAAYLLYCGICVTVLKELNSVVLEPYMVHSLFQHVIVHRHSEILRMNPFIFLKHKPIAAGSSLPGILKLLHHLACARLSAPDGHES